MGSLDYKTYHIYSGIKRLAEIAGESLSVTSSDMRGIDKTIEQREMRKEYVLQEIVEPLRDNYDFIFLDSPPTFSNLTLDILVASDSVMIPLDTSESASRGMLDLIGSIQWKKGCLLFSIRRR